MKKSKLFNLLMPLMAMSLVGCGETGTESESKYTRDATYHWIEDVENSKGEHQFEHNDAKSVPATCSAKGKDVETCKVCGYDKETDTAKLRHKYVVDEAQTTESTCTTAGKKIEVCEYCKDVKTTNLSLASHNMVDDPTATVTATCSQPGKTVKKCSNPGCTHTEETPIEKTAHVLGTGTLKNDNGKEYYEYECGTCHNKVQNRVKFTEWASIEGEFDSENKLSTSPVGMPTWNIQLPAGEYAVYFEAKISTTGKTLKNRSVKVTFNGTEVDFDNTKTDEDLGLTTSGYSEFTFCNITATGGVDKITLQNPHYRFVFNPDGYVTFKPVATAA